MELRTTHLSPLYLPLSLPLSLPPPSLPPLSLPPSLSHPYPAVGQSSTGVLYGASIGAVLVFFLCASTIAFLSIAMRKCYTAKHHRESQVDIADYASVVIVPTAPTVGVGLRPDLPQRRKEIHVEKNVAYDEHNRTSMIGFDDDGYPIMQRTGEYMDVLPPQTDPKGTATASEFQETKEHSSKQTKHNQDTECEDDGYPSLWP